MTVMKSAIMFGAREDDYHTRGSRNDELYTEFPISSIDQSRKCFKGK